MTNTDIAIRDNFEEQMAEIDLNEPDLPEISGSLAIRKAKKDIVRHLWAYEIFPEAARKAGVPLVQASRWRNEDERFAMWCEVWEDVQEQEHLARITKNVYESAEKDAKIGFRVLQARQPEKWNPGKVVNQNKDDDKRRQFIPPRGTVDAKFREIK